MLTVYVDFKSADAYLALRPTLALAERLSLDIDWRPFRTVERDVPQLREQETVGESHRRVRAASQRALAIKYAAHQGIDLQFPSRVGETDLALGVLAQLQDDRLPFIQAAFAHYWTAHGDLNDPAQVSPLLTQLGVPDTVRIDVAHETLAGAQDSAEEAGIVGAPAYVIADQIFVGRQHLPWIEELATEQAG